MSDQPNARNASRDRYRLAVNSYDRTSSLLITSLVMVGAAVLILGVMFFARQMTVTQVTAPVLPVDLASRPADAAMGLARDLEPPGIEDAPDLQEPKLEDTLNAITNAISDRVVLLSDEQIDGDNESTRGQGRGDSRMAGVGGNGAEGREPQRQVRFEPSSVDEYARWLDFFKIELGVLGRDNLVHYATNLSQAKPTVRTGAPLEDRRLYLNSAGSPLAVLDRRLARKAGIGKFGRIILQFYPPESQGILLGLEKQRAGNRGVDQITRTVFRVNRDGNGFRFSVEEQQYSNN